jgi:hypothetical protein
MTDLLHSNEKLVEVKENFPEIPSVNLNALLNSCAQIACCSSELIFTILHDGSSIQDASERAIRLVHPPFFCKLDSITATIQNQTHVPMNFLLTMTDTITFQNIYLSS